MLKTGFQKKNRKVEMMIRIIKVLAKTLIKKFGMITIEQGLNFIVPFLGLCVPILEQLLEHSDVIIKGAQLLKGVL